VRHPVRLLVLLSLLVATPVVCLSVGVAAWSTLRWPGAVATTAPELLPRSPPPAPGAGQGQAEGVVAWALAQLGTPYRWGGEGDGGFDCSGLVQAAFAAAGVRLPRVAQDQYNAGPHLSPGAALLPGDLVFFGSSTTAVDHVGIVVDPGEMIDAPHTGAVVRVEPIWPSGYIGATRPAS
jgi:cell wall-associated NlpC family hydrolase